MGSERDGNSPRFIAQGAQKFVLNRLKRFNVLVCHRGWGKTTLGVNRLVKAACETPNGRFAYLAPLYTQVKKTAWDALKYFAEHETTRPNEAELRLDFSSGARIQLFGADNYDALRGMHLDGIVLDEYAQMHPDAWDAVIRPALAIKQGFAIFIGTPQGPNHFFKLYEDACANPEWFTALYRWQDSGVFDGRESEIESARQAMSEDKFAQEYECSFTAAVHGAYYARQLEQARADGRIRPVAVEPSLPVDTWWDIGIGDPTAIIFTQQAGREVHIIDYLESAGQELAYYAQALNRRPYLYREHVLPHDADDRELGTGRSIADQLRSMVRRLGSESRVRVLPNGAFEPGIEAARRLFARCWIDTTRCKRLIEALMQYRAVWDDKGQTLRDKPVHDWTSHPADAFRYMAVGLRPAEFYDAQHAAPYRSKMAASPLPPMLRPGRHVPGVGELMRFTNRT